MKSCSESCTDKKTFVDVESNEKNLRGCILDIKSFLALFLFKANFFQKSRRLKDWTGVLKGAPVRTGTTLSFFLKDEKRVRSRRRRDTPLRLQSRRNRHRDTHSTIPSNPLQYVQICFRRCGRSARGGKQGKRRLIQKKVTSRLRLRRRDRRGLRKRLFPLPSRMLMKEQKEQL